MSKAARLDRLKRNLARRTNNFEEADKDMAFAVFYIEKEIHIMIDENFPVMKFYNYWDEYNLKKYNEIQMHQSTGAQTMRTMR